MKKSALLSLEAYLSDGTSSSDNEATEQRREADSVSSSQVELKSCADISSILVFSPEKPTEASHLSEPELDPTSSLSSCPGEVKKDSDNNLESNLKEPTGKSHLSVFDLGKIDSSSNGPAEVEKHIDNRSFNFSLISYLKEPAEASLLSDYELEQSDSLFSCSDEVKKGPDNNLIPNLKESTKASHLSGPELKQTDSLFSCLGEVKKDSDNDLVPDLKASTEVNHLSEFELEQNNYLSICSAEVAKGSDNNLVLNLEPTEASHFSESQLNQVKPLSSCPGVEKSLDNNLVPTLKDLIEASQLRESVKEHTSSLLHCPVEVIKDSDDNLMTHLKDPIEVICLSDTDLSKVNDSFSEPAQELDKDQSKANMNIVGENIQSSFQETPVTPRKKKCKDEKPEKEIIEKKPQRKSKANSSEVATLSKTKLNKGASVSPIPLPPSKEDVSTPTSSLKRSHSKSKENSSTPSSKRSKSMTQEVYTTTPFLKRSHTITKEEFFTPPRSHSKTKADFSTPSLKRSHSMIEDDFVDDDRTVFQKSTYLPKLDNMPFLSVPPPPPPPEGNSDPFSFFKKFPPPPLTRNHSLTEDESIDGNRFVFQKSTYHPTPYNFTASNSHTIRARRSFPDKHSSSFSEALAETPKRTYDNSSRRQSFPGKFSHRACNTDQTPYSPYQRHKRLRTELPYYNASDLLTFKSDDGFIDSHCHLDFLFQRLYYEGSYEDFQEENKDTFPHCYKGCLAIFCNPYSFKKKHFWQGYLEVENVWAAFGCHPHNARDYDDEVEEALLMALEHPKVRALGEIGLDYSNRNVCPKDIQQSAFRRQIRIAVDLKLPIVIHCRDAREDGMYIMKEMVPKNYFIHLHCFNDTWDAASQWLQEFPNLYIGITNLVTFPSASEVHEVAKKIPLNRLLLETDAPYFIPKPLLRDFPDTRFSHPGMAIHVAAQIAALKGGIPLELILHKTRQNTKMIYRI